MPSPFPGMDPYLEQFWGDVHQSFITYARDRLQRVLPKELRARIQERVFVELPNGQERNMYPDIRIVERGRARGQRAVEEEGGVALAEPLRIRLPDEPVTQGYIEIIDLAAGRRVVTVIEVLSPSNKTAGPGREQYERKQRECKEGGVHLVEIDLLRGGPWVLSVPEHLVPASHRKAYRVCVFRAGAEWIGEIYHMPLRERLPAIRVPLRPDDADAPLALQMLAAQCYENGGYDEDIDYGLEPVPPFTKEDATWADALLRQQGRRHGVSPRRAADKGNRRRKH